MSTNNTKPEGKEMNEWQLIGHSYQIADTGDYDGCYEITDGSVSIYSKDDDDEALQPIVDALNESGCKFYLDDSDAFENHLLKIEIAELRSQLSPSDHTAPQGGEEEWLLFNGLCNGLLNRFGSIRPDVTHLLFKEFKQQGFTIQKKQP